MNYQLLFCLSIVSLANATTSFQESSNNYEPSEEIDRLWKQHSQFKTDPKDVTQNSSGAGILSDDILTAKRKLLDPELRDLVIDMSGDNTRELAQMIQECVQNPNKQCPKRALLVGAPGIGKTTYIQAVAEKSDLPFIKINSAFVADKYKDSGPDNLKAIFGSILQTKRKTIVSFDELHTLINGHKNNNNPDQNTATALWLLMDQCAENPNIILMGTINDASDMPEQIKSRFGTDLYPMKGFNEVAQKQVILCHHLKRFKHTCDEKCQKVVAKLLKTADARTIEGIVESANRLASLGKEEWQITQKDLETAIKRTSETEKVLGKNEPDQLTKTLKAQEEAANRTKVMATIGGGATAVEMTIGWKNVLKKTTSAIVYFGKAGIELYVNGKKPNFYEIFDNIAKDALFEDVKLANDKQQK